jgi:hypothetical protein
MSGNCVVVYERSNGKEIVLTGDSEVKVMLQEINFEQDGKFIKKVSIRLDEKPAPPKIKKALNFESTNKSMVSLNGLSNEVMMHIMEK